MRRRATLAAFVAVALQGCGYALVGTGRGILPEVLEPLDEGVGGEDLRAFGDDLSGAEGGPGGEGGNGGHQLIGDLALAEGGQPMTGEAENADLPHGLPQVAGVAFGL